MVMYDRQHVLHLGIVLGVKSDQGQILCWLVTLRLDQDLVNVVSQVEGENERSLITLRGLHARRRTHDV